VTVVAPAEQWPSLVAKVEDTIEKLFIYYREGQLPAPATPAGEVPPAEETPAPEAAVSG
jgi:hypothetical protein